MQKISLAKENLLLFGVIFGVFYLLSGYAKKEIDLGFWTMVALICYLGLSIKGVLLKRPFFDGHAGTLEPTEENKVLRMNAAALDFVLLILALGAIYYLYY